MIKKLTLQQRIKYLLAFFITGLVVSGLTAFPIERELGIATSVFQQLGLNNALSEWLQRVYAAVVNTNQQYPFLAYGTDWLAFSHLVIAVVFIGPLIDPAKNIWVIQFGMIACLMVFPLALIAGPIRGIPFFHQLIDCLFGVMGFIPLWFCYKWTLLLDNPSKK